MDLFLFFAASVSSVSPQFYGRAIRYIKYTDIDARNLICKRDFEGPAAGLNFETVTFGSGNPAATCLSLQKGLRTMAIVKPLLPDDTSIQKVNGGGGDGRNKSCNRKTDFLLELTWCRRVPFLFTRRISAT